MRFICNNCSFYSDTEHETIIHMNIFCHSVSNLSQSFNKKCSIDGSEVPKSFIKNHWELKKTDENNIKDRLNCFNNVNEKWK
uniref:C2H2-type domain-containing protein n=1 Tax=Strongyloides venezuelensis TaxID=75913 RepID=A0A0K0FNI5_STRVS